MVLWTKKEYEMVAEKLLVQRQFATSEIYTPTERSAVHGALNSLTADFARPSG